MQSAEPTAGVDLLSRLSNALLSTTVDDRSAAIRTAAAAVAEYAGASRVLVHETVVGGGPDETYEWTRPGEPSDAGAPPGTVLPLMFQGSQVGTLILQHPREAQSLPDAVLGAAAQVIAAGLAGARAIGQAAAAEQRARAMLDDIGAVVVRVGPDGRVTFVNQAWTTLTGIAFHDIVGKDAMHHVHPDDRILAAQHMAALIGGSAESREVRFLARDGDPRWMEVKGRALFDGGGAVAGFAGILHDVTERRGAELQARDARGRAEHAQAVAERANQAKSDFLSRMSHELRTPLNAIVGFSELLECSDLEPDDAECVTQIVRAGRHLLDLVTEALDVNRIESGQLPVRLASIPVGEVVADCAALLRPAAAERRLTIRHLRAGQPDARVWADPQRLKQALLNVFSNAVKYSHPGGTVTVDCYPLDLETPFGRESDGGWLRIAVTDTGIGIPADRLDDVFLPFERIGAERTEVEGTGLGLALTRSLVEAMSGQIRVHSVQGVGTTFQIDLPAAAPVPDQPVPAS
ncbi:MAG: hypothetical protein V7603_4626 [Micromonosporaceae bacterium]